MPNKNNLQSDLHKVKDLWGQKAQAENLEKRKTTNWMVYPYITENYINQKTAGHPQENWIIYVHRKYIPHQLELGLSLGCGDGALERHVIIAGICKRFEAVDVADGAIEIAKAEAIKYGIDAHIKYEVADANKINLEENKYDVVFASSSVHHLKELEHVFDQVSRALKPAGLFILNEFVGPSQFQWTDQQLSIINDLLKILPAKYRTNISSPENLKEFAGRPSIAMMNSYDPSEAIRSAEIIPLLSQYFSMLEIVDYGGTILHMLLQDIVGNFDSDEEEDRTILNLLIYLEETLIKNKVLSSDFAVIIAQKPDAGFEPNPARLTKSNAHLPPGILESIYRLSGEDIAKYIPIRKLIQAIGFKVAARLQKAKNYKAKKGK